MVPKAPMLPGGGGGQGAGDVGVGQWLLWGLMLLIQLSLVGVKKGSTLQGDETTTLIQSFFANLFMSAAALVLCWSSTNQVKRRHALAVTKHAFLNGLSLALFAFNLSFVPLTPDGLRVPLGLLLLVAQQPLLTLWVLCNVASHYRSEAALADEEFQRVVRRSYVNLAARAAIELACICVRYYSAHPGVWLLLVADGLATVYTAWDAPGQLLEQTFIGRPRTRLEGLLLRTFRLAAVGGTVLTTLATAGYVYGGLSYQASEFMLSFYVSLRVGALFLWLVVACSISDELALMEREQLRLRERLRLTEESMAAKRKMLRYVCHELRSPLNVISLGLQLLLEGEREGEAGYNADVAAAASCDDHDVESGGLHTHAAAAAAAPARAHGLQQHAIVTTGTGGRTSPQASPASTAAASPSSSTHSGGGNDREALLLMRESAHSMMAIVSDLLDLAKAEAGAFRVTLRPLALRRLLSTIASQLQPAVVAEGVALTWSVHPSVPAWVLGDPVRLSQALLNFAGNAIKFVPSGGRGRVELSIEPEQRLTHDQLLAPPLLACAGEEGKATDDGCDVGASGSENNVSARGSDSTPAAGSLIFEPLQPSPNHQYQYHQHREAAVASTSVTIAAAAPSSSPAAADVTTTSPMQQQQQKREPPGVVLESDGRRFCTTGAVSLLRLSCRDNGPGIDPEAQQRLYQAFMQLEAGQAYQGRSSGLGLAIVKEIVASHGGRVGIASQVGVGSHFFAVMPFQVLRQQKSERQRQQQQQRNTVG